MSGNTVKTNGNRVHSELWLSDDDGCQHQINWLKREGKQEE